MWARRGRRPVAVSSHKYKWLYLYGFVRPTTGDVEWWVADRVGVALFQQVLDAFARNAGAGPNKTVILVLDNAGWHVSRKLRLPDGIQFCFLPAYTPELQPAERLWPLTNEAIANRPFQTTPACSFSPRRVTDPACPLLSDTAPEAAMADPPGPLAP